MGGDGPEWPQQLSSRSRDERCPDPHRSFQHASLSTPSESHTFRWTLTPRSACSDTSAWTIAHRGLHHLRGHRIVTWIPRILVSLPIHLELPSLITWENCFRTKNKPLVVVVAESLPAVAVIAFPVQNRPVCGEARQRKHYPAKDEEPHLFLINCWHIVLLWMHSTCRRTNFHPPLWENVRRRFTPCVFFTAQRINKQDCGSWSWCLYTDFKLPADLFIIQG